LRNFIIITARNLSKRFPNKVIKEICGKKVIEIAILRAKVTNLPIVLATSFDKEDDVLEDIAKEYNIKVFRGSPLNILKRWCDCFRKYSIDNAILVGADDVLYDYDIGKRAIIQLEEDIVDVVKHPDNIVCGLFGWAMNRGVFEKLKFVTQDGNLNTDVFFQYLIDAGANIREVELKEWEKDKPYRLTLDYPEDLEMFKILIDKIGFEKSGKEIIGFLDVNPDIAKINIHKQEDFLKNQERFDLEVKGKGWRFGKKEREYLDLTLLSGFSAGSCGTMNERVEDAFAKKMGKRFAITANSGTSTLHVALNAFGVVQGDEVIIPALSVGMCGFAVCHCGAIPVYADVRKDTFLIDVEDVERKITSRTKAIMVVYMYGLICDMNGIINLASKYNIPVLEDSAQCFMATDNKGRISGTIGDIGSWSFENSKHITCGDGGILVTDDENLAIRMRQFGGVGYKNLAAKEGKVRISRDKFQNPDWERHNIIGYNYRLPEVCAAIILAQLDNLDRFVSLRQAMGRSYLKTISEANTDLLIPQVIPKGYVHSYYTFAALFNGEKFGISWKDFRKKYMEFGGDGIYAANKILNSEPAFKGIGWGDVPVAEELQKNLMLFTTNQRNEEERQVQMNVLEQTLVFFEKKEI